MEELEGNIFSLSYKWRVALSKACPSREAESAALIRKFRWKCFNDHSHLARPEAINTSTRLAWNYLLLVFTYAAVSDFVYSLVLCTQSLRLLPFGFLSLFCGVCMFILVMEKFPNSLYIVSRDQKIAALERIWRDPVRMTKGGLTLYKLLLPGIFMECSWSMVMEILQLTYFSSSLSSSPGMLSRFLSNSPLHQLKLTWCPVPSEQVCTDLLDLAMIFLMYLYIVISILLWLLWKRHLPIGQVLPGACVKASALATLGQNLGGNVHGWEFTSADLWTF